MQKDKNRITVGLCCNSTGTDKLKPVVIHKSLNPRCFKEKKFQPSGVCYWYSNKTAWMTQKIFKDIAGKWNAEFRRQNRQVVILLDNCSGHFGEWEKDEELGFAVYRMSHILFVFLPPNTTSLIQPLDQGIIQWVKVKCALPPRRITCW